MKQSSGFTPTLLRFAGLVRGSTGAVRAMVVAIAFTVFVVAPSSQAISQDVLSFGVVPQQAASRLARNWIPILKQVGRHAGITLRFQTAKDIPEFEARLRQGVYDLAYMNPYHYTVFHENPGYRAIARKRGAGLQGIIVVGTDSVIQDLKSLSEQILAFPAPSAFAASVLPRAHLSRAGIAFTPRFVSLHNSVYLAVAKGLMLAGGGIMRTLNGAEPETGDKLPVLWRSKE